MNVDLQPLVRIPSRVYDYIIDIEGYRTRQSTAYLEEFARSLSNQPGTMTIGEARRKFEAQNEIQFDTRQGEYAFYAVYGCLPINDTSGRIRAIKKVKNITNWGLKESKEFVELVMQYAFA